MNWKKERSVLMRAIRMGARLAALPAPMDRCGAVDAPWFIERVRGCQRDLCAQGRDIDLMALDFDHLFFDQAIPSRGIDRRIRAVIDRIKSDPSAPFSAEAAGPSEHIRRRAITFAPHDDARVVIAEKRPAGVVQKEAVAAFPGGIALMDAQDVKPGMKVMRVNGRLPGETGYPLH